MILESGNIIHSLSSSGSKWRGHVGIAYIDDNGSAFVIHKPNLCHPTIDTLQDYENSRPILSIEPCVMDNETIMQYYEQHKGDNFSLLTANCEHFAYGLYGNPQSPTLAKTFFLICALSASFIVLRKIK